MKGKDLVRILNRFGLDEQVVVENPRVECICHRIFDIIQTDQGIVIRLQDVPQEVYNTVEGDTP